MSFTTLDPTDFVVSSDSVTAPAWTTGAPVLSSFYTASAAVTTTFSPSAFYLGVYQIPTSSVGSAVQFSIAYGNVAGSGSVYYNQLVAGPSPTMTTYKQYRNLVYGPRSANTFFNFGGLNAASNDIFVLNIDRNSYRESLFPGTFNLTISGSGGYIQLCDNSNDVTSISYLDCGRVFDIVSGSYGHATVTNNGSGKNGYTLSGSYGLYLPDIGTIILNPDALQLPYSNGGVSLNLDLRSNPADSTLYYSNLNNTRLFNAISGGGAFQLNSQETISSNYVFIRIKNAEYNYSANPTFTSGSGNVLYPTMVNSPQTFVTTVGLYNNNHDLMAVAKLSKPLVKDFTKEALVTVKLDW